MTQNTLTLIGPFTQVLPLANIPAKGPVKDASLQVINNGGIIVEGDHIHSVGNYEDLITTAKKLNADISTIAEPSVLIPGMIDAHTHICSAGSRANDYAMRNAGFSYLDIAKSGGGIWDTVKHTRAAAQLHLKRNVIKRATQLLSKGITTIEVKSGYGLSVAEELKMLRAIKDASLEIPSDLIATCLAAHIFPKDYTGNIEQYLKVIANEVFPIMASEKLAHRVDAFIEEEAFNTSNIIPYLNAAKQHNFDITIHADQFHPMGSQVAIDHQAISADHLESSGDKEIEQLAKSDVTCIALPGASLGLGMKFTPARKILDQGGALAIASDWNPGSAPMGDLLTGAAILGAYEKLSTAEVLSGITFRAAHALGLKDRGKLENGFLADLVAFDSSDYREILYHQGQLQPSMVWKKGKRI